MGIPFFVDFVSARKRGRCNVLLNRFFATATTPTRPSDRSPVTTPQDIHPAPFYPSRPSPVQTHAHPQRNRRTHLFINFFRTFLDFIIHQQTKWPLETKRPKGYSSSFTLFHPTVVFVILIGRCQSFSRCTKGNGHCWRFVCLFFQT